MIILGIRSHLSNQQWNKYALNAEVVFVPQIVKDIPSLDLILKTEVCFETFLHDINEIPYF